MLACFVQHKTFVNKFVNCFLESERLTIVCLIRRASVFDSCRIRPLRATIATRRASHAHVRVKLSVDLSINWTPTDIYSQLEEAALIMKRPPPWPPPPQWWAAAAVGRRARVRSRRAGHPLSPAPHTFAHPQLQRQPLHFLTSRFAPLAPARPVAPAAPQQPQIILLHLCRQLMHRPRSLSAGPAKTRSAVGSRGCGLAGRPPWRCGRTPRPRRE